jgi:hypothetical protein
MTDMQGVVQILKIYPYNCSNLVYYRAPFITNFQVFTAVNVSEAILKMEAACSEYW